MVVLAFSDQEAKSYCVCGRLLTDDDLCSGCLETEENCECNLVEEAA